MSRSASDRRAPGPVPVHRDRGGSRLALALLAAAVLALAPPAQAQDTCAEPGMNGQCSEFGAIVMADRYDIRGQAVQVPVTVVLNTAYEDREARWMLFSARSIDAGAASPVTIDLAGFASSHGDVVTTKVEQPSPGELNLWVDTLDTPVGTPIVVDLVVGATERGAYRLETLVMAFDRGFAPIQDSEGKDASLYSFTMLGVNAATDEGGGGFVERAVPAPGALPTVAAMAAAVAVALLRRRSA